LVVLDGFFEESEVLFDLLDELGCGGWGFEEVLLFGDFLLEFLLFLLGFLDLFRGGGFEFAEEFFDGVRDVDLEEDEDEDEDGDDVGERVHEGVEVDSAFIGVFSSGGHVELA
jgi:hypothetical protein